MSKIVKIDAEQLSTLKWKKCPLGVIHPEHTPVTKIDEKDTFADLVVTAKPANLNFKSSYIPPPSVPIKRPHNVQRRPKSAKPGTDVVGEALKSIPEAKQDRKSHMRTSLIAGKDLKNSINDYKTKLSKKKIEVKNNKQAKKIYDAHAENIDKALSEKFKSNKLSDHDYSEIKQEIFKLRNEYESQLYKQKIIVNFLALKEQDLDLQELNRIYAEIQLKKEKELINVQHFVLKLREITVTQNRSLVAYVRINQISKILEEYSGARSDERDIISNFLEKVKIQLIKDKIEKDCEEVIPFGVFEKCISNLFVKWEREKVILEGFLNDIVNVFCQEFNLPKEIVINSKPKNKRETELKVVAEFVNMYLEKLHNTIESKIRGLEKLKNVIENGKEIPLSLTEVLFKSINSIKVNKTHEKNPTIPNPVTNSEKNLKKPNQSSKSRSKSPQEKKQNVLLPRKSQEKLTEKHEKTRSNVGKNAKKYTNGKLSSIPEERKKSPVGISRKNPLDSVTSLNQSLDEGLDDIITDLNPLKSDSSKQLSLFTKPKENVRKPEMDSTEGLFNFRAKAVPESREIFASIDAPLMQSHDHMHSESVYESISQLENARFPKKPPETRSELIKSGIKQFHPYMDKDGKIFNPQDRFPNTKADDIDPFDPYFLEEIGNRSPDRDKEWFLRSHHLRSFTNHPLSINDNPNFYKAQVQVSLKEDLNNKPIDQRDVALSHLEKTLEDLKCELETRRRIHKVSTFTNENRLSGHIAKAVTPISQGLDINEKEGLVLHTYESILNELRAREKDLLNEKRFEAYEINRPPQDKWFELKSNEFTKEMQRHLSSLKPKEEQRKLLNYLAIPDLY